ncbi:hypothetical protein BDV12DRAFT_166645 [Aspergillus spectabilis]
MSRNFLPPLLAILVGIGTGYYAFQPAFRDLQREKGIALGSGSQSAAPAQAQSPDQKLAPSPTTTPAPSSKDGSGK